MNPNAIGIELSGINGSYTLEEALSQMLAGTGYGSRFTDSGAVIVNKLDKKSTVGDEGKDAEQKETIEEIIVTADKRRTGTSLQDFA